MTKVKDWVQKWKDECGTEKEPNDVLLIIKAGEEELYGGHFLDTPEYLWERDVYKVAQVLDSSDANRIGAYCLDLEPDPENL